MIGSASYVSRARASNRLRHAAQNINASENQSHAGPSSSNWRHRAPAISSPGSDAKGKQPADENHGAGMRLGSETDNSFSAPQYRFPTRQRAAWEAVGSAPAWGVPSSSSSASGDMYKEVTNVQLKNVSPITTTVNGEEITLTNRFSFDVAVVRPRNVPLRLALGELRRLDISTPVRRLSSEDSELRAELQEIVNRNLELIPSPDNTSSQGSQDSPTVGRLDGCENGRDSATTVSPGAEVNSGHAQAENPSEKEARFQDMLSRLQNRRSSSSTYVVAEPAPQPQRVVDPAIIAMKVKDEAPQQNARSSAEAANAYLALQLSNMRNAAQQNTTNSGYASNEKGESSSNHSCAATYGSGSAANETGQPSSNHSCAATCGSTAGSNHTHKETLDDGQNKVLNPAAAEFRYAAPNDGTPWLVPKRMTRPPLTNVFPNATTSHVAHATVPGYTLPQQPQQSTAPAVAGPSNGNRAVDTLGQAPVAGTLPALQPGNFAAPVNGHQLSDFASVNTLPQQIQQITAPAVAGPSYGTRAVDNLGQASVPTSLPALQPLNLAGSVNGQQLNDFASVNTVPHQVQQPGPPIAGPSYGNRASDTIRQASVPASVPASQPGDCTGFLGRQLDGAGSINTLLHRMIPPPGLAATVPATRLSQIMPPPGLPVPPAALAGHQILPPPGLAATVPPVTRASQIMPPPGLPVPLAALTGDQSIASLQFAAMLDTQASSTAMNLPGVNRFNTFPPTVGNIAPVLPSQVAAADPTIGGVNPYQPMPSATPYATFPPPAQAVQQQTQAPQPATGPYVYTPIPGAPLDPTAGPSDIAGSSRPPRPYFPVTVKPRDHDPVKQQEYERYLEWRKVNEPGYHMKCKMRQAQRVVRQYQQQQEKKMAADPTQWKALAERQQKARAEAEQAAVAGPSQWKAIADQAKAAVEAAAAAAREEKKLAEEERREREDRVREELRVKVREASERSRGGGEERGEGSGSSSSRQIQSLPQQQSQGLSPQQQREEGGSSSGQRREGSSDWKGKGKMVDYGYHQGGLRF